MGRCWPGLQLGWAVDVRKIERKDCFFRQRIQVGENTGRRKSRAAIGNDQWYCLPDQWNRVNSRIRCRRLPIWTEIPLERSGTIWHRACLPGQAEAAKAG